jgi:hypothetical protein
MPMTLFWASHMRFSAVLGGTRFGGWFLISEGTFSLGYYYVFLLGLRVAVHYQ